MAACSLAFTEVRLYVGYGWNEATNLACAIAELAAAQGLSVRFCSTSQHASGVDTYWDAHQTHRLPPAGKTTLAVWLDYDLAGVLQSVRQAGRSVLVASRPTCLDRALAAAVRCSDVVAVDADYFAAILPTKKAHCIPPECSGHSSPPQPLHQDHPDRSVWLVDGETLRRYGGGIAHVLNLLLSLNRQLQLTLIRQGACDPATNRLLMATARQYPDRLTLYTRASRQLRQSIYSEHGWGVVLTCRTPGITYLLEGLRAGLHMAGLKYGGAVDTLASLGGWAIDCPVAYNPQGLPYAEIDQSLLLDAALCRYEHVRLRSEQPAPADATRLHQRLVEHRLRFTAGWEQLWQPL
jgi:hypothetical protein